MKKLGLIIFIIILILCIWPENTDSVRVRVVANSNSEVDQKHKNEVVKIMKKIIKCDDTYDDILNKYFDQQEKDIIVYHVCFGYTYSELALEFDSDAKAIGKKCRRLLNILKNIIKEG